MVTRYDVIPRLQYSFPANGNLLAEVISASSEQIKINIVVADLGLGIARIVVGPPDNNVKETNNLFETMLSSRFGITNPTRTPIIQLKNIQASTGTIGSLNAAMIQLLGDKRVQLVGTFIGEPSPGNVVSIFFEVPQTQLDLAIDLLRGRV